jgi:hypothetical protein
MHHIKLALIIDLVGIIRRLMIIFVTPGKKEQHRDIFLVE